MPKRELVLIWCGWPARSSSAMSTPATRSFPDSVIAFHPLDPRTPRLLQLLRVAEAAGTVSGRWVRIGRAVEAALAAHKKRSIPMNIDGVQAIVFCELGFEPEQGRGLFILSRAVGILAHAWEQKQQGGRIKGPMPTSIPYRYRGSSRRAVPDRSQFGTTPERAPASAAMGAA